MIVDVQQAIVNGSGHHRIIYVPQIPTAIGNAVLEPGQLLDDEVVLLTTVVVVVVVEGHGVHADPIVGMGRHQQVGPVEGIVGVNQVNGGQMEGLSVMEIQTPEGGELGGGRAAGESIEGGAIAVSGAVIAEEKGVVAAADGGGLGCAAVADLGAEVLLGERVGGVDVMIAQQTQLGAVGSAV